jgi:hypothetical protein
MTTEYMRGSTVEFLPELSLAGEQSAEQEGQTTKPQTWSRTDSETHRSIQEG